MLLGYDQRNHADLDLQAAIRELQQIDIDIEKQRLEIRDRASEANQALQLYNNSVYDRKHKKPSKYQERDLIMIRNVQNAPGINRKLAPKFKGPYRIHRVLSKNRYVVTDVPGHQLSNRPYNSILSPDKIKPWIQINKPRKEKEMG